uniref:Uncharacterized protein n=1 Tax=Lygus hesperus TaxID=30085 RepID=A0A0K8SU89_LYGHE
MSNTIHVFLSAILVICLDVSLGLSSEEFKSSLLNARKYCNESQVDPATLAKIKQTDYIKDRDIITPQVTCFLDCILKKSGLVENDKLDEAGIAQVISQLGDNEEHGKVGVEALKKCIANKQMMSGKCNAGEYFKVCEHEYAQDLSFLSLILKL